jgi:hypothetical protein
VASFVNRRFKFLKKFFATIFFSNYYRRNNTNPNQGWTEFRFRIPFFRQKAFPFRFPQNIIFSGILRKNVKINDFIK